MTNKAPKIISRNCATATTAMLSKHLKIAQFEAAQSGTAIPPNL